MENKENEKSFTDYLDRLFTLFEDTVKAIVNIMNSIANQMRFDFESACIAVCVLAVIIGLFGGLLWYNLAELQHLTDMANKGLTEVKVPIRYAGGSSYSISWVKTEDAKDTLVAGQKAYTDAYTAMDDDLMELKYKREQK